jgi:hypothetical protein
LSGVSQCCIASGVGHSRKVVTLYSCGLAANLNGFTSGSNPGKVAVQFMAVFLSSGLDVGGKIAAIFGARVFGVRGERGTRAARVLPDAPALIPMKAQTPECVRGGAVAGLWKLQLNPLADNLGQLVLAGQLRLQQIQNRLRRQFAVRVVFDGHPLRPA